MAAKKAFTKGEEVTVFNSWDDKGTASFTHAVVYSCGTKQMVLTDAVTGNEIGRHFSPVRSSEADIQVIAGAGWERTFPRMTDEEATRIAEGLGAVVATYMSKFHKKNLHEPQAINRTGAK